MTPRLRDLGLGPRVGLTALLLTILLGLGASAAHLYWHSQNRDERPGMTLDDIRASYRGLRAPAPLHSALERGHPEGLSAESRKILGDWLASAKISENYDSLDLGAAAPAEVISKSCLSCHSRKATDAKARVLPLENWEDVKKVAFARDVSPNPDKVLAASSHAHALSLATLSIVLTLLALASSLPRGLTGALIGIVDAALLLDIGSWWLARYADAFVTVIAGAGFIYNAGTALLALLLIIDMWRPGPRGGRATPS